MKKIMTFALAAGIFITACSMPTTQQQNSVIATAAALTVQAALNESTPLASPTFAIAQATQAPTLSPPMASVGEVTNCRTGPDKNYDRVTQVVPNEPVKIIGFFPSTYWIVSTTNGECWLAAEFTTPSGNFGSVPRIAAPPTPLGEVPEAPSFSKNGWTWFCYGTGETDVTLSWNDNANNEKGYRVYRNGEIVIELPANSTLFKETVLYPGGEGLTYKIETFNEIGTSSGSTDTLFCE